MYDTILDIETGIVKFIQLFDIRLYGGQGLASVLLLVISVIITVNLFKGILNIFKKGI